MVDRELAIATCLLEKMADGRWYIAIDLNCDGAFTISDVWLWLKWWFFMPGDGLLWALMQWPEASTFLELSPEDYSSWPSAAIWLILFVYSAWPSRSN